MTFLTGFLEALPFSQKAPELADVDDIFGWLVGSWEMDAVLHDADRRLHRSKASCTPPGCWGAERSRIYSFSRAQPTALPACRRAATGTRLR